ncbi:ZIP family metal transporter [Bacillaceae bacterium]
MESVLFGSILSAMSTGMGALIILFFRDLTHRWRDILLAFTAGIMVAASTFSLMMESLALSGIPVLMAGVLMGTFVLTLLERYVPHIDLEHSRFKLSIDDKARLVIAAITLHNLPEGLSVGVSYASGQEGLGGLIAFAIGLQNVPEGFLVALFLLHQRVSRLRALFLASLTGAVEIVTALIGYTLTNYVENLVPFGLAFAAGAMLFIVYKELIPESHGDGHETGSTYSFIIGLLTMVALIHWFG